MMVKTLDFVIYWAIVLIPFVMAIAPAPMHVFVGLLIFSFLLKKIISKQKPYMYTALNLPFMLFFIAAAVSMLNSVSYRDSFRGLFRLLEYFFLFLVISAEVKDHRHAGKVIISIVCAALLLSVDAIWQVSWGRDFIRGNLPIINIGLKRATASFPDANVLGIYLSAVAPVIITLALYYFKRNKKIIICLVGLLVLAASALTYSRPTLLAIFVALLLLGIVKKNKILLSILVILIVMAPFILPSSVKDWAKQIEYNPLRFMCNDDRIAIYRNSLNMIEDHPVIGVGVNTFMKNYKKYKESPEYRGIVTSDYIYAHNNFLHMAAEVGIVGLGIFLWLIYRLFKASISIYKKLESSLLKNMSLGLILCLAAFLVNGLTESSLYYSRIAMIFWYLSGLSLSLGRLTDANQPSVG
ncbi:MAG: O-antigen ligase family protein [Candidatus Omnitrophica bacterium]|nr:O-antigen ligase family protein [Candidatus Omnitrophota bacterium]